MGEGRAGESEETSAHAADHRGHAHLDEHSQLRHAQPGSRSPVLPSDGNRQTAAQSHSRGHTRYLLSESFLPGCNVTASEVLTTACKTRIESNRRQRGVFLMKALGSSQSAGGDHTEGVATSPCHQLQRRGRPRGWLPQNSKGENRLFHLLLWIKLNENLGLYVTLSFIICALKIVHSL